MTDSIPKFANMMAAYKAWASDVVFSIVAALPEGEAVKPRPTLFKNMVHTLNHLYVVDRIFQAHLEGRPHGYTARNTPTHPPLQELWQSVTQLDRWYIDHIAGLSEAQLGQRVEFQFVGGGDGNMSRLEILLHLVNHGTYHRGFVGDMLNQAGVNPRASDLPVFLRDVWNSAHLAKRDAGHEVDGGLRSRPG
jgi:uncharacterized damage-inducible protein DinB